MPELPEVECLTRSIRAVAEGGSIKNMTFYRKDLREPIPIRDFQSVIKNQKITSVSRRSKYLLLHTEKGTGIFHLGMTGNILCYDTKNPQLNHTHAVFQLMPKDNNKATYLHFVDPRRFGYIHCHKGPDWESHKYFNKLGPEPLEYRGLATYLFNKSRDKTVAVKNFIMNGHIVVGVGNIYANEALYKAKIHPEAPSGSLSQQDFARLCKEIKTTLKAAISQGGTTLKDFKNPKGEPGYFKVSLKIYGRKNEPCHTCSTEIEEIRQSNRASFFCPTCQII